MIQPFISVIIPARNESKFIESVLTSILNQDYPCNLMEVIIADGMSDDVTLEKIDNFKNHNPDFKIIVIQNERKIVPTGLNKAIRQSKGEVIVRLDAHSVYPIDYISRLVSALSLYNADNVGGVFTTLPAGDSNTCHAIAFASSHPLGVGNSFHRIGLDTPMEVDTVPYGCFRRDVFDKIGYFDEELVRNQDDEFNGRMRKNGLKVFMVPDVALKYYARDSYKKLFKMFYQYGLFKPLTVSKLMQPPTFRQMVPAAFVTFLFLGLLLSVFYKWLLMPYLLILLFYTSLLGFLALRQVPVRGISIIPHVLISFFTIHFSYGLGYLKGLFAVLTGWKKPFKIDSISR